MRAQVHPTPGYSRGFLLMAVFPAQGHGRCFEAHLNTVVDIADVSDRNTPQPCWTGDGVDRAALGTRNSR
jgi:hypothetical protein